MSKSPLHPRRGKDMFVGYGPVPGIDRRTMLTFGVVTAGITSGFGYLIAKTQAGAGRGDWDMATQLSFSGRVYAAPYAHMRTLEGGRVRTLLLGCETKCGARDRLEDIAFVEGGAVVHGSLLERDGYGMVATRSTPDWIMPDSSHLSLPAPVVEDLGEAELTGEILDTKCWFGAMRPNEGLSHKACATLCIASGVPPYFGVKDGRGRERALMITDLEGRELIQPLLSYVAEPVRAAGRIIRVDDLFQFRMDPGSLRRV